MSGGTYRISDIVLSSDIRMPELDPVDDAAEWRFTLSSRRPVRARPTWFHRWRNRGEPPMLSFGRVPDGYLMRFHGRADFTVNFVSRSIVGWRGPASTLTTLRHLLIDQVVPLVLSRDRLVLHASAVATPSGAVAFVGYTGAGKSTLAAALAVAGLPMLADDCLVIEPSPRGFVARPFYPGVRLWADSVRAVGASRRPSAPVAHYTRKRRLDGRHLSYQLEGLPLRRVFVLDRPVRRAAKQPLTVTALRGPAALVSILECTFQIDIGDAAAVRRTFEMQSRLVRATPVHRLTYPWQLSRLSETRDAIVARLLAPN